LSIGCEDIRLGSPGTSLAACRWGQVGGLPVLALHGWMDNAASFDLLAPALCGHPELPPLDLVALDLPGHGYSDWRAAGGGYAIADYAVDVLAAVERLQWRRFVLIGHSLGAGIATLIGGACPDRLAAAVLIDGLGPLAIAAEESPRRLARALADRLQGPSPARRMVDMEAAVEARTRSRFPLGERAARLLCARGTRTQADGSIGWRADPRLKQASTMYLTEAAVLAFLDAMTVPTLLIQASDGAAGEGVQHRYRRRAQAHPALTHVVVAGNHHVHLDGDVDTVGEHVAAFLLRQGLAA
jgi:pimeloyl-ACP methyl ester carboxylesterase